MTTIKTDDINFNRDVHSGALVNNDTEGLQMYRNRRTAKKQLTSKVENLESRFDLLESKLDELINLLRK